MSNCIICGIYFTYDTWKILFLSLS